MVNVVVAARSVEGMMGVVRLCQSNFQDIRVVFVNSLEEVNVNSWCELQARVIVLNLGASSDFVRDVQQRGYEILQIAHTGTHSWKKVLLEEDEDCSKISSIRESQQLLEPSPEFRRYYQFAAKSTDNDFSKMFLSLIQ